MNQPVHKDGSIWSLRGCWLLGTDTISIQKEMSSEHLQGMGVVVHVYEDTDEAHENDIDTGARQLYAPTLLFVKDRKATRFSCTEWDQSITHSTGKDRENLQNKLQSFLVSGTF